MPFDPVTVIIRGKHDSGRTTLASLLKSFLEENGYRNVTVEDTEPLPRDEKPEFMDRFNRTRDLRPVKIRIELEA